jgi:hypothetical protein
VQGIVKLAQDSVRKFTVRHNLRFVSTVEKMKADFEKDVIRNLEVATIKDILNGSLPRGLNMDRQINTF